MDDLHRNILTKILQSQDIKLPPMTKLNELVDLIYNICI